METTLRETQTGSATPASRTRRIRSRATSRVTQPALTAWVSPTVPRAAEASSSTAGRTICRSPTTASTTTQAHSLVASTLDRANLLLDTFREARRTQLLALA